MYPFDHLLLFALQVLISLQYHSPVPPILRHSRFHWYHTTQEPAEDIIGRPLPSLGHYIETCGLGKVDDSRLL